MSNLQQAPGIYVALPTAFNDRDQVLVEPLQRLIGDLCADVVQGFLVCGSMGLGPLLDLDEFETVLHAAAAAIQGRPQLLIAGCGAASLAQTLRRVRIAEQAGAPAICVTTPYFFKFGDEELFRYFQAILEDTALDVYIYEVPIRTGNSVAPAVIGRLLEYPNLRGIKVTSFDLEYLRRIVADFSGRPGLSLFSGINRYMPAALAMGYRGFLDGLFALDPRTPQALIQAHDAGRRADIQALHRRMVALDDFLGTEGVWPAFTALLHARGYAGNWLRAPQMKPDAALEQRAAAFAAHYWAADQA